LGDENRETKAGFLYTGYIFKLHGWLAGYAKIVGDAPCIFPFLTLDWIFYTLGDLDFIARTVLLSIYSWNWIGTDGIGKEQDRTGLWIGFGWIPCTVFVYTIF
jgi:hypothetical protein